MDRKKFIISTVGAVIAVVIGRRLDVVPHPPLLPEKFAKPIPKGVGIMEQIQHRRLYVEPTYEQCLRLGGLKL